MTPRNKAQELIRTFKAYSIDDYAAFTNAYRCVEEIIKANPTNWDDGAESTIPFWQQVKQELQKM